MSERPFQRKPSCRSGGCLAPLNSYGQCTLHPFADGVGGGGGDGSGVTIVASASIEDPINPKHYKGDLVMRILEAFGLDEDFNLGNVIKYLLRHGEKAGLEDLKKGRWYLDRAIAKREGKLPEKLK